VGPFLAGVGESLTTLISYVMESPGIASDTLQIAGAVETGTGSAQVVETICVGAAFATNLSCEGTAMSLSVNTQSPTAAQVFAPTTVVGVNKSLIVRGGALGTAAATSFSNVVESPGGGGGGAVPEPSALILLGSGLLLISISRLVPVRR